MPKIIKNNNLISKKRGYKILTTADAKKIASSYISDQLKIDNNLFKFGLPEIDDRHDIWRVPLVYTKKKIGEIVINAKSGSVNKSKTTKKTIITERLSIKNKIKKKVRKTNNNPTKSTLNNTVILGDSEAELKKLPKESVNLIFTSPPYYNAKPEYAEYATYDEYLKKMASVIKAGHRVLSEGRFFVINISPILIRRASRSQASKRIAVPFDFHPLFIKAGFDFIDDIHWVKPEGVGWAFGRGRRFAADRNPLQYKAVPITEYILVYRKKTDRLIDWNIRNHHNQQDVKNSKIGDDYEKTNLWKINPTRNKLHPATFPLALPEKVIKYYSFENDIVLDPFGGIGTTGKAAINLNRKFALIELENEYMKHIKSWIVASKNIDIDTVDFINTSKPKK